MTQDKILILDFGSQVSQLIARRVREAHVYCELHSFDMPLEEINTAFDLMHEGKSIRSVIHF